MKADAIVKVKKLNALPGREAFTPSKEDHVPGTNQCSGLPVDYEIEGYLIKDIKVGSTLLVDRRKRNGLEVPGIFETTPLQSWDGRVAKTQNSTYIVEAL